VNAETADGLQITGVWTLDSLTCSSEVDLLKSQQGQFLLRVSVLARYITSSCVWLSVTRRYCIKTAKLRITQTTPRDSLAQGL